MRRIGGERAMGTALSRLRAWKRNHVSACSRLFAGDARFGERASLWFRVRVVAGVLELKCADAMTAALSMDAVWRGPLRRKYCSSVRIFSVWGTGKRLTRVASGRSRVVSLCARTKSAGRNFRLVKVLLERSGKLGPLPKPKKSVPAGDFSCTSIASAFRMPAKVNPRSLGSRV